MLLRYLAKILILPPMAQVLLIVLAWLIRRVFPRTARVLLVTGIGSLWLLGSPFFSTQLTASLEWYSPLRQESLNSLQADAIVILAGSQKDQAEEFGESISDALQLTRIRYGAFLAKRTGIPVLLSGGTVFGHDLRSGAETMAYDLEEGFGVQATWLESRSRTTMENGLYSYEILNKEEKDHILLVTGASHMPRSVLSFEKAGFTVIPAPTMFVEKRPVTILSFIPNSSSLELSSRALHEWLGLLVYTFTS